MLVKGVFSRNRPVGNTHCRQSESAVQPLLKNRLLIHPEQEAFEPALQDESGLEPLQKGLIEDLYDIWVPPIVACNASYHLRHLKIILKPALNKGCVLVYDWLLEDVVDGMTSIFIVVFGVSWL